MSDLRERELQRQAASGDPGAAVALQRGRERRCLHESVEVESNDHEFNGVPRSLVRASPVGLALILKATLKCQDCKQSREFSRKTLIASSHARYGPVKSSARAAEAPDGTLGVRWRVTSGYGTLTAINSWERS